MLCRVFVKKNFHSIGNYQSNLLFCSLLFLMLLLLLSFLVLLSVIAVVAIFCWTVQLHCCLFWDCCLFFLLLPFSVDMFHSPAQLVNEKTSGHYLLSFLSLFVSISSAIVNSHFGSISYSESNRAAERTDAIIDNECNSVTLTGSDGITCNQQERMQQRCCRAWHL